MMRWIASAVLVLLAGCVVANLLVAIPEVRKALRFPPDTPVVFSGLYERLMAVGESAEEGTGPSAPSLAGPPSPVAASPSPRPRTSWAVLDTGRPPADPRTNPLIDRTDLSYMQPRLERRLATLYRRARLPLRVLRVSFASQKDVRLCGVEIWTGRPPSRSAIEETAAQVLRVTFDADPRIEEIDLVALPWRNVEGLKAPTYYSIVAGRVHYPGAESGAASLRSPRLLLDRFGPQWWDPRVSW